MRHLLIIFSLLLISVGWSKDEIYVCQPIAKTNIDSDSAIGDHIKQTDNLISRYEKPKLLKIKINNNSGYQIKVEFGGLNLKLTDKFNIFTHSLDIYHFYETGGSDSSTKVMMHYWHNANNTRETFRQKSIMYYCDKS